MRGRLAIAEDIRQNFVLRHRVYCRFADFTWDVLENQIVRQVVHALGDWDLRHPLHLRLRQLDRLLGEVTLTQHPATMLDRIAYHRLNDDYRPIHRLCRLFLEGSSLSETAGAFAFPAFLIDMNRLFEAFVTQLLRDRARSQVTVDDQVPMYLGRSRHVAMRLDLLVRRGGKPALVADCKYKRFAGSETQGHDVYQVLAYCTATAVARGALIYPAHPASVEDEVAIRHTDVRIHRLTIDLGRPGAAFEAECERFAKAVWAWAETPPARGDMATGRAMEDARRLHV